MRELMYLAFPGGRYGALTLSYDDGVVQDERLLAIMEKNGLRGTFNLNSGLYSPDDAPFSTGTCGVRLSQKKATELFQRDCAEVAVHTVLHPTLPCLTLPEQAEQILEDRKALEAQFHRVVRGMAYPNGPFDEDTVAAARLCDIAYARTVCATLGFSLPRDWLRLNPTCHHNEPRLMALLDSFLTPPLFAPEPRLFYLWGHSYEFDGNDNWRVIEEFAEKAGGHDSVWYATNGEIYEYVEAFRALRRSADGRILYNPTATRLYAHVGVLQNHRLIEIAPGETICLND